MLKNRVLGGVLLVSGTTIGAAILALPTTTGQLGYLPSTGLFILYWAFLTFSALLMLEVTLWMEDNTNLITMARLTLGYWGEVVSWTVYLFLLYSLTTAYLAGSTTVIHDFILGLTTLDIPKWFGAIPLILIFGYFVYRGARSVDRINRYLMLGLIITFLLMIAVLTPYVETEFLDHIDMKYLLLGNSVIATSFGFHIIIPTLSTYLHRNPQKLRRAILIGSCIPLGVYLIWNFVALSIIPVTGDISVATGYEKGENGVQLITQVLGDGKVSTIARFFSFFSIVTSFLGVSLSLMDFLADGFQIRKSHLGRAQLYLMTFLPPLLIMLINPRAFLSALEYAGAFGVMILLALLPALMVWKGRYKKLYRASYKAPGGKLALLAVIAFAILSVILEVLNKVGFTKYFIEG